MGDVVQISQARRSRPRRPAETDVPAEATIAFFTGVRIERWSDRETDPVDTPRKRPTSPRSRRRRT